MVPSLLGGLSWECSRHFVWPAGLFCLSAWGEESGQRGGLLRQARRSVSLTVFLLFLLFSLWNVSLSEVFSKVWADFGQSHFSYSLSLLQVTTTTNREDLFLILGLSSEEAVFPSLLLLLCPFFFHQVFLPIFFVPVQSRPKGKWRRSVQLFSSCKKMSLGECNKITIWKAIKWIIQAGKLTVTKLLIKWKS